MLQLFPQNTATDFKIRLAERISFNKNCKVSLQSLFLSNKLFNISGETFNVKKKLNMKIMIKLKDFTTWKMVKHFLYGYNAVLINDSIQFKSKLSVF